MAPPCCEADFLFPCIFISVEEHTSGDSLHLNIPRNFLDVDVAYLNLNLNLNFTTPVFVFPQEYKAQVDVNDHLGPERLPILKANNMLFQGLLSLVWEHKHLLTSGDALSS